MKRLCLLILSACLILTTGCTEERPASGWDVGQDDAGGDTAQDSGGGGDTDQDAGQTDTGEDSGQTDAGGDTGTCGASDNMCDWDCPEQDPDCAECPDKSEFTGGPWDTESCMVIDFGCADGTHHYSDEVCGCGCLPDTTVPCAAQDARGQGPCAAVIGVVWDGTSCRSISGCSCVGSDCDKLYDSVEACQSDRSACIEPDCEAQDVRGTGPCDAVVGWAWTGSEGGCHSISGCECEGSDCDQLYDSEQACQRDNIECGAEVRCGGFGGIQCPDGMFCDYQHDSCGADDGTGVCEPTPDACPEYVDEVCGCDGQIYTNECFAHSSGTDVWQDLDACSR